MFTNRWILLDLNRMAKYFRQSFLTYRQEKDKLYLICLQYFCYFSESDRKCQWLLLGLRQLTCKVTMTTICFHPLSLSLSLSLSLFPRCHLCQTCHHVSDQTLVACSNMSCDSSQFPSEWQFLPPSSLPCGPNNYFQVHTNFCFALTATATPPEREVAF